MKRFAAIFLASLLGAGAPPPAGLPLSLSGDDRARIVWGPQFSSENDDWINELVDLRNGNVLAVGFLNRRDGSPPSDWQALAAEISPGGALVAEQKFGSGSGIDAFWSAAEAPDGSRMLAGFTTRIGAGGIDAFALHVRADGTQISERAFGGGGYDRFTSVTQAPDGYIFLGHSQAAGEDKRRIFLVKTDRTGTPLWERIHDAPESWGALYIAATGDSGFVVAGGTALGGDSDMFAMKVDVEGHELWRKRVGVADWDEVNHGLVIRPDGRIILAGYAHRRGEESNDLVAATLDPTGKVERIERFGGAGDDRAILAKLDGQGRVWIVGHSASDGAGGIDLALTRLDRKGRFEAAAITIGTPQDDHGTALLPLGDGSLLLAGYSRGLGGGAQDAFVLKLREPRWDQPNPKFRREVAIPTPAR